MSAAFQGIESRKQRLVRLGGETMTLIIGARCSDGIVLAADRRRLSRYEKGPETNKVFRLDCDVVLAGAGDDAVLNEARVLIDRRVKEVKSESPSIKLFDIVEITAGVVNELVSYYKDRVEEPFGYALSGLEDIDHGNAKLYTVFGAGLSEVPWVCHGAVSSYARPLLELLLAEGDLPVDEASKVMAPLFTLVSNVQTTVGGGVDMYVVKDGQRIGQFTHSKEVSLEGLRFGVLKALGIQAGGCVSRTE